MKNVSFITISSFISAILLLAGCNSEEPFPSEEQNGESLIVAATCESFTPYTRVGIIGNSTVWSSGDSFGLFEREGALYRNSNVKFSLDEGSGNSTALFTGYADPQEGWATNEKMIYAYYPYDKREMMASEIYFELPYRQTQSVNTPLKHMSDNNRMISSASISEGNPIPLQLNFKSIFVKVDFPITNNSNDALDIEGVRIQSMDGSSVFMTEGKYSLRDALFNPLTIQKRADVGVDLDEPKRLEIGDSYTLSMFLFPFEIIQNSGISIVLKNSRKEITIDKFIDEADGLVLSSGSLFTEEINLTESSFIQSGTQTLSANQNSFIVAPPTIAGQTHEFLLPISRANIYWGVDNANVADNIISSNTNWVANIIWKDVDLEGNNSLIELTEGKSSGVGPVGSIGFRVSYKEDEKYGNAVIGIRKADANFNPIGEYLWSWHIWISDFDGGLDDYSGTNGFKLMDRNLGAKSKEKGDVGALGLLYQWGRKDPFIGASKIFFEEEEEMTYAPTTHTWPTPVPYSVGGTVPYAVMHPTTFITSEDGSTFNPHKSDWLIADVGTLWTNGTKTIYDPCPKGFKVASRNSWASLNSSNFIFDELNRGRAYEDVWYPAAGCIRGEQGKLMYVGTHGYATWSSGSATLTVDGILNYYARNMYYYNDDLNNTLDVDYRASRAHAVTIRCMEWSADQ